VRNCTADGLLSRHLIESIDSRRRFAPLSIAIKLI
jgi:hypothetical protein